MARRGLPTEGVHVYMRTCVYAYMCICVHVYMRRGLPTEGHVRTQAGKQASKQVSEQVSEWVSK